MKVLFVNSVCDYGSTGKIVRDLANGLKKEGHEVLICYGRHQAKEDTDTFYIGDKLTTYSHVFMTRVFNRHGLHSNRATQKLIEKIETFNPDVIHLHNLHGYYLNVEMLFEALKTFKGKIYWTFHDCWPISGSSAYFDYHGCKTWDEGCVECNSTRDYPEALVFKRQKKNFLWKKKAFSGLDNLTLVTPSYWLKELLAKSFLAQYPCEVIHNGINTNLFKPTYDAELTKKYENKLVLLGVASIWEQRKGLNDFIKLSTMISDNYKIVLIGLTEEQKKSLPTAIDGVLRTDSAEQLAAYYTLSHRFINPTYEDNYPTTNIEALCCHTPVIAYDTGGNKEVSIKPFMTIVPQGDLEAIVHELNSNKNISFDHFDSQSHDSHTFVSNTLKLYQR
ncbi:glycosyltransferase [Erysipelothrix rhusiopathiae]|uniref:Glycosyltransferase, group 1 family protein n=1 Tax=Erysipelothrix rhusiopathiae ATCC 19414 TaxID=525280 RepID=E7FV69_ERYRH|nr:glycosyltransferase [Erysipelothrix rhusiopathiae]AGN24063.1 group 1 glycosyl transferase [Erysipelothrix rhusiopathiae SY1027]AMS11150.1 glycosyl transferase [Erysipelothrix rhusiopathiae]AOO67648.1 glycosyl transferase [Erysipelothrix rhusiopathiae]AWU41490.1 glycosyltransferase [Erysipelothrix rhusiopathiae]EFY09606.1 glycosyltransferase, group 1 family protein [Erysipelothrix rhusiopathiae ATCC 19414]